MVGIFRNPAVVAVRLTRYAIASKNGSVSVFALLNYKCAYIGRSEMRAVWGVSA